MRLSEQAERKIDSFWANDLGCLPEDFQKVGVGVTERQASEDLYIHIFHRLERIQVDCSLLFYEEVRRAVHDRGPADVFEPVFWRATLGDRVERTLGPTYLGYKDSTDDGPINPHVRLLSRDTRALLNQLRQAVVSQEWEHSGLEEGQPIAGYFLDGALVAAAGYKVWGGTLAHIGVTTCVGLRGRGFGRACVWRLAGEAIKIGLIAQYQTLFENEPSIAIARALEFEEYGKRMFVRCKAG